ncbi:DoxX family protein [Bacillus litorisediminis]|uniref:DoxX family protein n=1 Tax=Bacillus litorisediminis TaxID=2922713 RepID=UPI001FAF743B|nr:DoxX family protein [Bacillus litorisediminis]
MNTYLSITKLLRYLIAYVFITSGVMKLWSEKLENVFNSLPLPFPAQVMYTVACTEIICGLLIALNKRVKSATIPLIMIMIGALLLTKVPALHTDLIQFAFQARLDVVMLGLLFILYKKY